MKKIKILLKDKSVLLFCAFVIGSSMFSAYQESNSTNVNPSEEPFEIVFESK